MEEALQAAQAEAAQKEAAMNKELEQALASNNQVC